MSQSSTTSMPIDDPPNRGFDDIGARKTRRGGLGRDRHPGQGGQPVGGHHRPEGELVHAQGGAGHRRPGVGDAGQVQRSLQGAVLAGPAVATQESDVDHE